ncbi:hypothetical protein O9993_16115 [Vibrio lentus]|nr:hypothetical protein [Vibrio lentus]
MALHMKHFPSRKAPCIGVQFSAATALNLAGAPAASRNIDGYRVYRTLSDYSKIAFAAPEV